MALAAAACDHAGIRSSSLEIVGTWQNNHRNLVCRLDAQHYLKLYTREPQRQFHAERCALQVMAEHGRALATRLIDDARAAGYQYMRLDTGILQMEAQSLYHSLGFKDVPPHIPVPDEFQGIELFMEKDL